MHNDLFLEREADKKPSQLVDLYILTKNKSKKIINVRRLFIEVPQGMDKAILL